MDQDIALEVAIRTALVADASVISELANRTFRDTYGAVVPEEDMNSYVRRWFSIEMLVAEIQDPKVFYLLVENNGQAVGYGKLCAVAPPTDPGVGGLGYLSRLYLKEDMCGHGVGPAVLRVVVEEAKRRAYNGLWVSIWEENTRSMSFCRKVGFIPFGRQDYMLERCVFKDILLYLRFVSA